MVDTLDDIVKLGRTEGSQRSSHSICDFDGSQSSFPLVVWDKLTTTITFLLYPTPEANNVDIRVFENFSHVCRVSKEVFIFSEALQMVFKTIELPFDGIIKTEKAFRALTSGVSFVTNLVAKTCINDSFQTTPNKGGGHRIRLSCVQMSTN